MPKVSSQLPDLVILDAVRGWHYTWSQITKGVDAFTPGNVAAFTHDYIAGKLAPTLYSTTLEASMVGGAWGQSHPGKQAIQAIDHRRLLMMSSVLTIILISRVQL